LIRETSYDRSTDGAVGWRARVGVMYFYMPELYYSPFREGWAKVLGEGEGHAASNGTAT